MKSSRLYGSLARTRLSRVVRATRHTPPVSVLAHTHTTIVPVGRDRDEAEGVSSEPDGLELVGEPPPRVHGVQKLPRCDKLAVQLVKPPADEAPVRRYGVLGSRKRYPCWMATARAVSCAETKGEPVGVAREPGVMRLAGRRAALRGSGVVFTMLRPTGAGDAPGPLHARILIGSARAGGIAPASRR